MVYRCCTSPVFFLHFSKGEHDKNKIITWDRKNDFYVLYFKYRINKIKNFR